MNRDDSLDARKVIAEYDVDALTRMFKLFGELKNARRIAEALVKARSSREIVTIADLLDIVKPFINPRQEKKELAQVFQALRMEVNHEVDALAGFLSQTLKVLKPGGKLAIITYHSIEDRMVKTSCAAAISTARWKPTFSDGRRHPYALSTTRSLFRQRKKWNATHVHEVQN